MKILRGILFITVIVAIVQVAAQDNKQLSDDDYFILKYIAPNASPQEQLRILDSIKTAKPKKEVKEAEPVKPKESVEQPPKTENKKETKQDKKQDTIKKDSIKKPPAHPLPNVKKEDINKLSPDELFMLAFKTERVRAHYFVVHFFADGQKFGTTDISYDSTFSSFDFYSVPFSQYLDSVLLEHERPRINGTDGVFNSKRLIDLGFEVHLNELAYELHLELPPEVKKLQYLNLGKSQEPIGSLIKPAFFSFFANLHATESVSCAPSRSLKNCDRALLSLNSNGALAMFGFALEGSATFREWDAYESRTDNLRRGDIRLVKDIYSLNSRLILGDVSGVAGLRYEYSDRMFSRNRLDEKHKINFYLQRAAYVEIHIDGKLRRRLYLPSGYHELSGFAGHTGENLVQVFIPKEDGTMEEVKYQFELGDARTMQKGESRYYINGGIRKTSVPRPSSYKYDINEPGLSAYYYYGLFHSTSIGYNTQLSKQNLLSGLQISNANILGYTELRGSISASDSSYKIGNRLELMHFMSFDKPFISVLSISLSGYIQNSTFNSSLFEPQISASSNFAGFAGSIGFGAISAVYNVAFNRDSKEYGFADFSYGISASASIKALSLYSNVGARSSKASSSYYFSVNAGYSFGVERNRISLNGRLGSDYNRVHSQSEENPDYNPDYIPDPEYMANNPDYAPYQWEEYVEVVKGSKKSSKNGAVNLRWSWRNGDGYAGGHSYSASIGTRRDFKDKSYLNTYLSTMQYFNRAEFSADYSFYKDEYINNGQTTNMGARFGTSFMFADGLWAFGRPVSGGFILADADNSLAGSTVRMNYSRSYNLDLSHSGWLGAAYQNSISHYNPNSINITLKDMPAGAWLEQNQYYVIGAYKQGYALKLGNDMRVLMQTTLKDEKGALSNIYVAIFQIDEEGKIANKKVTFTSKEGVLQMGNLIPGAKYRLTFDPSTYIKSIDIEVPKDSEPFMDMPEIKVERE